jgi:hypothetical protein
MPYYNPYSPYKTGFAALMEHIGKTLVPAVYRYVLSNRLENIVSEEQDKMAKRGTQPLYNPADRGGQKIDFDAIPNVPSDTYPIPPSDRIGAGGIKGTGGNEEKKNQDLQPFEISTTVDDKNENFKMSGDEAEGEETSSAPTSSELKTEQPASETPVLAPFVSTPKQEPVSKSPYIPPPPDTKAIKRNKKLQDYFIDTLAFPESIAEPFRSTATQFQTSGTKEPDFNEKRFMTDKEGRLYQMVWNDALQQYVSAPVIDTEGKQLVKDLPKFDKDRIKVARHPQTGEVVFVDMQDGSSYTLENMPLEDFDYQYALEKAYKEGLLSQNEYELKLKEMALMQKAMQGRGMGRGRGRGDDESDSTDVENIKVYDINTGEELTPQVKEKVTLLPYYDPDTNETTMMPYKEVVPVYITKDGKEIAAKEVVRVYKDTKKHKGIETLYGIKIVPEKQNQKVKTQSSVSVDDLLQTFSTQSPDVQNTIIKNIKSSEKLQRIINELLKK